MPITKSAKKALRQSKRKRAVNVKHLVKIRTLTKQLKKLSQENKISEARELLSKVYQALDKAVRKDVIKKNTAARKKSRLAGPLFKK